MDGKDVVQFDFTPVGNNGKVSLTVRLGDDVLAMDKLDVVSARARDDFAKRLCKDRPGVKRAEVDTELLRIAAEVQARHEKTPQSGDSTDELDVTRIVRPELFHSPEVSGLTVATPILREGRPAGRWRLYLRWADGKREARELGDSISLPDGSKLWIYPTPGEPGIGQTPAWTEAARKAWLAGADSPDPAEVFRRLCEYIAYFIDFPEDHAPGTTATLALWTILTYCYPAWSAIPYIYLGGPVESGKTRVLEVLARLIFRPLQTSNMTAAALFRTLHSRGGTLLYDEAERLRQNAPDVAEINSMLLAGYKRGGKATRMEPVGDTFKTKEFQVFGPKALACIRGLPPVLASRCISLTMFRAAKDSLKPRQRIDDHADRWQALRANLHALALDYGAKFSDLAGQSGVCPAMSGRAFELWQPLLALASWVEEHGATGLLAMMQEYAQATIEAGQDEQTPDCDETLLRILADFLRIGKSPIAKDILEKAREEEQRIFDHWKSGKAVAVALGRYGIKTRKTHGRKAYGHVTLDDLRRVQTAYNMDLHLPESDCEVNDGDTPQTSAPSTPSTPEIAPDRLKSPLAGVHGAHGAHR